MTIDTLVTWELYSINYSHISTESSLMSQCIFTGPEQLNHNLEWCDDPCSNLLQAVSIAYLFTCLIIHTGAALLSFVALTRCHDLLFGLTTTTLFHVLYVLQYGHSNRRLLIVDMNYNEILN